MAERNVFFEYFLPPVSLRPSIPDRSRTILNFLRWAAWRSRFPDAYNKVQSLLFPNEAALYVFGFGSVTRTLHHWWPVAEYPRISIRRIHQMIFAYHSGYHKDRTDARNWAQTSIQANELRERCKIIFDLYPYTVWINNFDLALSAHLIDCYKATSGCVIFFNAWKPIIKGRFIDPFFHAVSFLAFSACYQAAIIDSIRLRFSSILQANNSAKLSQYVLGRTDNSIPYKRNISRYMLASSRFLLTTMP